MRKWFRAPCVARCQSRWGHEHVWVFAAILVNKCDHEVARRGISMRQVHRGLCNCSTGCSAPLGSRNCTLQCRLGSVRVQAACVALACKPCGQRGSSVAPCPMRVGHTELLQWGTELTDLGVCPWHSDTCHSLAVRSPSRPSYSASPPALARSPPRPVACCPRQGPTLGTGICIV